MSKNKYIGNCHVKEGRFGISGYGQIDLTNLAKHVEENRDLVKVVTFKDGSVHELLPITIDEKKPEYKTEHQTHSIKISEPK